MIKKITALLAAASIMLTLSACRDDYTKEGGVITTADIEQLKLSMETTIVEDELFSDNYEVTETSETTEATAATLDLVLDREGTLIGVPAEVNRIVSGSERITQLLIDLGVGGKIVAADKDSAKITGISPSVCTLNKKIITASALEEYKPDVVFINVTCSEPMYSTLKEAGVNVICIPDPSTIEGVKLDIQFLAEYLSVKDKGQQLVDKIDGAIVDITTRSESITAKRKVYFESQSGTEMKAYADNTLEGEILSLVGGINMLAGQSGIVTVTSESVVTANPNVIVTTVSATGYDVNEIKTRTGWDNIKAVKNGSIRRVSEISATASIVDNIYEIAKAVYPEIYKDEPAASALAEATSSSSQPAPSIQTSKTQAAPAA